jgi:hypothetical protein
MFYMMERCQILLGLGLKMMAKSGISFVQSEPNEKKPANK